MQIPVRAKLALISLFVIFLFYMSMGIEATIVAAWVCVAGVCAYLLSEKPQLLGPEANRASNVAIIVGVTGFIAGNVSGKDFIIWIGATMLVVGVVMRMRDGKARLYEEEAKDINKAAEITGELQRRPVGTGLKEEEVRGLTPDGKVRL